MFALSRLNCLSFQTCEAAVSMHWKAFGGVMMCFHLLVLELPCNGAATLL